MDSAPNFTTLLQNGIGLTQARQRNAVITYGFDTCFGLMDTDTEGIKDGFHNISRGNRDIIDARNHIIIREQVKQRLYGAREEFLMKEDCGANITSGYLTAFTINQVNEFTRKHKNWKDFKTATNNMTSVKVPKLNKNNWKDFSQAIKELLTRERGTNNIPLSYIIRSGNHNYDDTFDSTGAQLSKCIALTGGNYHSDNSSVWFLLLEHSTGTEAEPIMNRFKTTRNGRRKWQVLLAHVESDSYVDNLKLSAMKKISTDVYNGEKKNVGIVKYYQIQSEVRNDLAAVNEPLSDGMKITHFL